MPNENMNQKEAVAVEEKPTKRVRKTYKVEMTGEQIIKGIEALQKEVAQMESEVDEIAPNSVFRSMAQEKLNEKRAELARAYTTVYRA